MKLISCSRKKIIVYEEVYISPLSLSASDLQPKIHAEEQKRTGTFSFRPPTKLDESADTQSSDLGEGVVVAEHKAYKGDLEIGLAEMRKKMEAQVPGPGIRERVLKVLQGASEALAGVKQKGTLKVGKKSKYNLSASNIVEGK
jgi:hypothetical protein